MEVVHLHCLGHFAIPYILLYRHKCLFPYNFIYSVYKLHVAVQTGSIPKPLQPQWVPTHLKLKMHCILQ